LCAHVITSHVFMSLLCCHSSSSSFLLRRPAPTAIHTLSLHDALPIFFSCAHHVATLRSDSSLGVCNRAAENGVWQDPSCDASTRRNRRPRRPRPTYCSYTSKTHL